MLIYNPKPVVWLLAFQRFYFSLVNFWRCFDFAMLSFLIGFFRVSTKSMDAMIIVEIAFFNTLPYKFSIQTLVNLGKASQLYSYFKMFCYDEIRFFVATHIFIVFDNFNYKKKLKSHVNYRDN